MVPVRVLEERGCPVLVAKFAAHAGLSLAMFGGGGISLAEKLVKSSDEYLIPKEGHDSTLDLTELSCRWQPIAPRRGQVLSLLVQAKTGSQHRIYATIVDGLTAILGGLETVNPVRPSAMHYRSLRELWSLDRQHGGSLFLRFKRMLQSAVAFVLFRLGLYRLLRVTRRYVDATPSHSDYRKFDDMLRMVIDRSEEHALRCNR